MTSFHEWGLWPGRDGTLNILCMWKAKIWERGLENDFRVLGGRVRGGMEKGRSSRILFGYLIFEVSIIHPITDAWHMDLLLWSLRSFV